MLQFIKKTLLFHFFKIQYFALVNRGNRRVLINYCKKVFENKDVFLIGSGPSANSITEIPTEAIVACCNFSPEAIESLLKSRSIDVYLTSKEALLSGGVIENILKKYRVDYCIHNQLNLPKKLPVKNNQFYLTQDVTIARIVTPELSYKEIQDINSKNENTILSSGMQLLSYILLSNPRSVILAGIDTDLSVEYFDNLSYNNDYKSYKKNNHYIMDKLFLERVAKEHKNIIVPKTSPIYKIFKSE
jgi:hypothetical protein